MKKILKASGWVLLALTGAMAAAWIGLLIVDRSEEQPASASIRLSRLHVAQPQVHGGDNGYVFMLGFGAGVGQDPQGLSHHIVPAPAVPGALPH